MRKLFLALAMMSFAALVSPLSACHIENNEGRGDADDVCGTFCAHLMLCGEISPIAVAGCKAQCEARYDDDDDATRKGCACVEAAGCKALSAYKCEGAPLPTEGSTGGGFGSGGWCQGSGQGSAGSSQGSAGSSQGSAGSSQGAAGAPQGNAGAPQGGAGAPQGNAGGSQGTPGACADNHDCALGDDCVGGQCLPRCKASCECQKGASCVEGYCHDDAPPPQSCVVDCECPSGQRCDGGICVP